SALVKYIRSAWSGALAGSGAMRPKPLTVIRRPLGSTARCDADHNPGGSMSPTIEPRPRGRRDAKGLIRSRAAALLTSMLFVGACQSPPSGSDLDLWGALRSGPLGLEVDPPSTVADISSSAEVVLKGRV